MASTEARPPWKVVLTDSYVWSAVGMALFFSSTPLKPYASADVRIPLVFLGLILWLGGLLRRQSTDGQRARPAKRGTYRLMVAGAGVLLVGSRIWSAVPPYVPLFGWALIVWMAVNIALERAED